jgi:hypothetical protein
VRQKRSEDPDHDAALRRSRRAARLEFGLSLGGWGFRAMVFEEFARFLPATIFCCTMFGAVSTLMAELGDSPYGRESWYMKAALIGMFPLGNTVLIATSVKYGAWRIWPLGVATIAGIGLGLWFSKGSWERARHLEPYSIDSRVWIVAALLVLGWFIIAGWLYARRRMNKGEAIR